MASNVIDLTDDSPLGDEHQSAARQLHEPIGVNVCVDVLDLTEGQSDGEGQELSATAQELDWNDIAEQRAAQAAFQALQSAPDGGSPCDKRTRAAPKENKQKRRNKKKRKANQAQSSGEISSSSPKKKEAARRSRKVADDKSNGRLPPRSKEQHVHAHERERHASRRRLEANQRRHYGTERNGGRAPRGPLSMQQVHAREQAPFQRPDMTQRRAPRGRPRSMQHAHVGERGPRRRYDMTQGNRGGSRWNDGRARRPPPTHDMHAGDRAKWGRDGTCWNNGSASRGPLPMQHEHDRGQIPTRKSELTKGRQEIIKKNACLTQGGPNPEQRENGRETEESSGSQQKEEANQSKTGCSVKNMFPQDETIESSSQMNPELSMEGERPNVSKEHCECMQGESQLQFAPMQKKDSSQRKRQRSRKKAAHEATVESSDQNALVSIGSGLPSGKRDQSAKNPFASQSQESSPVRKKDSGRRKRKRSRKNNVAQGEATNEKSMQQNPPASKTVELPSSVKKEQSRHGEGEKQSRRSALECGKVHFVHETQQATATKRAESVGEKPKCEDRGCVKATSLPALLLASGEVDDKNNDQRAIRENDGDRCLSMARANISIERAQSEEAVSSSLNRSLEKPEDEELEKGSQVTKEDVQEPHHVTLNDMRAHWDSLHSDAFDSTQCERNCSEEATKENSRQDSCRPGGERSTPAHAASADVITVDDEESNAGKQPQKGPATVYSVGQSSGEDIDDKRLTAKRESNEERTQETSSREEIPMTARSASPEVITVDDDESVAGRDPQKRPPTLGDFCSAFKADAVGLKRQSRTTVSLDEDVMTAQGNRKRNREAPISSGKKSSIPQCARKSWQSTVIMIDSSDDEEPVRKSNSASTRTTKTARLNRERPRPIPVRRGYNSRFGQYNFQFSEEEALREQERLLSASAARVRQDANRNVAPRNRPVSNVNELDQDHWKSPDMYARLGLARGAPIQEIKRRFRRLALLYHPDKSKYVYTTARFQAVTEAYKYLCEESERLN